MQTFANLAIKRKLMVIIMVTSSVALLLACAGFFAYDYVSYRDELVEDLTVLSEMTEENTRTALVFNDRQTATTLLAAFKVHPNIVSAYLLDGEGRVFAEYVRANAEEAQPDAIPASAGHVFTDRGIDLYRPILWDQRRIGALYVRSDMSELERRLRNYALIFALVMSGASAVALLLSSRLQRVISEPIRELARLEKIVTDQKDYSVRARRTGNDEVGLLIDGFNEMLAEIQGRDGELRVARDRAEQANRSKSAFLANMSHELRTPLNAIIGYSEMLQEDAADLGQEAFVPDLQKINAAGKHLLGLINDVLDLSKIEAGKMDVYLEDFDVATLVEEVASTVYPLIEKNGNALDLRCAPDAGTMHADVTKVRQVLFNLLSNASKFTKQGTITLEVSRGVRRDAPWLSFVVRDTGIGMTEEQIGRLFQAFSQADASTTRKFGGTGLGLAISRHFTRMMGGSIKVTSEPGHGSVFTVELPALVVDPQKRPTTASGEIELDEIRGAAAASRLAPPADAPLVLVIDDDRAVQELMSDIVRKEGLRAVTAGDAKSGIEKARELHPALITLDVMMPEEDGWSLLSRLKAEPELADIPVIMLTVVDDRNKGYALGAAEYMTKPIDRARLVALLHKVKNGNRSVLVVDDDDDLRSMLQRMLVREGWEVREADNGLAALRRVAEKLPGLILLDLMMPELDGFGFLRELRKTEDWRSIPVVVLTSLDLGDEERKELNGCVDRILRKGAFSLAELENEVRSLVRSSLARTTSPVAR